MPSECIFLFFAFLTCQLAVVQLGAVQRVGSERQHVLLRMDRLQLLQGRLPAADALHKHTQRDATGPREYRRVWTQVRVQAAHLTLASEAPLVQPGPDALDPPRMLRVATVVPAGTLVLLHLRVVHQACTHTFIWDFSSFVSRVPDREADHTCCEAQLRVGQGQGRHCGGWVGRRQGGGGWGGLGPDKRLVGPNQSRHAGMEPLGFRDMSRIIAK